MSDSRIPERDLPQGAAAPTSHLRAVQDGRSVLVPIGRSGGVASFDDLKVLSSFAIEETRGEARFSFQAITTRYASLRNPSPSVPYTNAPVAIRVGFAQGECPSADHLAVLDDNGLRVPFQWEGAVRPFDESSIAHWPDGSLRAGNVWVLASLAAGQAKQYAVNCYRAAQGQSFPQKVVYTAVSGTIDELDTPSMRCRFENAQAWNLRRYQDKANASFDLFAGVHGLCAKYQPFPEVGKYSYFASDVTQVSHGIVGAGAFGYGVVFQEYETVWTWVAEPTVTERMRYRVFADGAVRVEKLFKNSAYIAPSDKHLHMVLLTSPTGLASSFNAANTYKEHNYTGSSFLFGLLLNQSQFPGSQGESLGSIFTNDSVSGLSLGRHGTTPLNAGGQRRVAGFLSKMVAGDSVGEWSRRVNPICAFASVTKPVSDLRDLSRLTRSLAATALPIIVADTAKGWFGVAALLRLLQDGNAAADEALGLYQQWCAARAIAPASSGDYYAKWFSAAAGLEFQSRNTQALWWLREAYIARDDAVKLALVESYIHAYADALVAMEVTSGPGKMLLRGGDADVYNARTAAIAGLATSIAIAPDAVKQATLGRLVSGYNEAAFAGAKWSYSPGGTYMQTPTIHYYAFQTFELLMAKGRLPSIALPAGDVTSWIREAFGPNGVADEWRHNYQEGRRGLASTPMYAAACAALAPAPDHATAHELARHVDFDGSIAEAGLDGFDSIGYVTVLSTVMDIRALAEVVLRAGL